MPNLSATIDIKLQIPIEVTGVKTDKLTMRRPKVGDQLAAARAGGSPEEKEVRLIGDLLSLPPDAVMQIDVLDYKAVQEAYADFTT